MRAFIVEFCEVGDAEVNTIVASDPKLFTSMIKNGLDVKELLQVGTYEWLGCLGTQYRVTFFRAGAMILHDVIGQV